MLQTVSAATILESVKTTKLSTGSSTIDAILGGGVPRQHVLQVCGPPGSGKEGIVMGLIHSNLERGREVLFYRLQSMISPHVLHASLRIPTVLRKPASVHFLTLNSFTDLLVALDCLDDRLSSTSKIGLIVLDGFGTFFDHTVQDYWRSWQQKHVLQVLVKACTIHDVAAVLTVNLSTKLIGADGSIASYDTGSKAILTSQLGVLGAREHPSITLKRTSKRTGLVLRSDLEARDACCNNSLFQLVWQGGVISPS